jgi:hypothetical protein
MESFGLETTYINKSLNELAKMIKGESSLDFLSTFEDQLESIESYGSDHLISIMEELRGALWWIQDLKWVTPEMYTDRDLLKDKLIKIHNIIQKELEDRLDSVSNEEAKIIIKGIMLKVSAIELIHKLPLRKKVW